MRRSRSNRRHNSVIQACRQAVLGLAIRRFSSACTAPFKSPNPRNAFLCQTDPLVSSPRSIFLVLLIAYLWCLMCDALICPRHQTGARWLTSFVCLLSFFNNYSTISSWPSEYAQSGLSVYRKGRSGYYGHYQENKKSYRNIFFRIFLTSITMFSERLKKACFHGPSHIVGWDGPPILYIRSDTF